MLVTGLPSMVAGMVNAPDAFLSHPVMVTVPSLISYFKLGLTGTASFSPHPPRSRGSDTHKTNRRKGFMGYFFCVGNSSDQVRVSLDAPIISPPFETSTITSILLSVLISSLNFTFPFSNGNTTDSHSNNLSSNN